MLTLIHMDLLHLPFLPLRHCRAPGPGRPPEVRVKDLPIVTFESLPGSRVRHSIHQALVDSQVPGLLWGWPTPRGADATGVGSVCPVEHVRWAAHVAAVLRERIISQDK